MPQELSMPIEAIEKLEQAKKLIADYVVVREELKDLGILRSGRVLQADLAEWLVAQLLELTLSDNPVQATFDAWDGDGKTYQIKSRVVSRVGQNTSFDFEDLNDEFDYFAGVLFNKSYELVGLIRAPFQVVKDLSRKNLRRVKFRLNKEMLSDPRVEKLIWKSEDAV
jgi:hypothetical protein